MNRNWSTIEVLKHSRHDWLNKIQLIKGNIALHKMDRVNAIIEEIVIDAQNESNLTNLQIPSFAAFIMTYNWESHKCKIDYEVLGNSKNLSNYDDTITDWCVKFLTLLEESADNDGEYHVSISIDCSEQEIRFFFDFSGILNESEKLTGWFEQLKDKVSPIQITEYNVHNKEMSVTILIT